MPAPTWNIFVSYDSQTGLEYARQAKRVIAKGGYQAWVWECDRVPGAYPAEEIAKNIRLCDFFFYLCTAQEDTQKWNGQEWERNLAWGLNKPVRVLTVDPGLVPLMLKAYTYVVISVETFSTECREIVDQLATRPILGGIEVAHLAEEDPLDSAG